MQILKVAITIIERDILLSRSIIVAFKSILLELCIIRSTGERNNVADIRHTCYKEQQALKAQSES